MARYGDRGIWLAELVVEQQVRFDTLQLRLVELSIAVLAVFQVAARRGTTGTARWKSPAAVPVLSHKSGEAYLPYGVTRAHEVIAAIAVLIVVTATEAYAQGQEPKASKAEVQKLVNSIKSDKTKFAQSCDYAKLVNQASALAEKNQNDPRLEALDNQTDDIAAKIGPDFEKIANSDMDDASAALLQDLAKTCE
jgi:hypothetical protein